MELDVARIASFCVGLLRIAGIVVFILGVDFVLRSAFNYNDDGN